MRKGLLDLVQWFAFSIHHRGLRTGVEAAANENVGAHGAIRGGGFEHGPGLILANLGEFELPRDVARVFRHEFADDGKFTIVLFERLRGLAAREEQLGEFASARSDRNQDAATSEGHCRLTHGP